MIPVTLKPASREFQIFAKPAGAVCNLGCSYCYYLEKRQLYPGEESFRMPEDLLERYIVQHIEAAPGDVIAFSWHGGEPMVAGLDYFRKIAALQRKHQPAGRRIVNGVQTNGTLLDGEWCRFFKAEGFHVGLSLDGPAQIHDRYRLTLGQEPTHAKVLRAFELLRRYRIPCDMLCTVNDQTAAHPLEVYRFFREMGAPYLGFLPVVERMPGAEGAVGPHTMTAEAFGTFLCAIFDEWIRGDTGRIMVQIFEEASRPARGLEHSACIFRETCGDVPVVEHNGDFYSCDHFVDAGHLVGNIRETSLVDLLESPRQAAFGLAKRDALPLYCRRCEVRAMCNGGCPKDRFIRTPDGEQGLNYLCAGFKKFFHHSRARLARVWPRAAEAETAGTYRKAGPAPGRNDPCACGSGRKYKKCCMRLPAR